MEFLGLEVRTWIEMLGGALLLISGGKANAMKAVAQLLIASIEAHAEELDMKVKIEPGAGPNGSDLGFLAELLPGSILKSKIAFMAHRTGHYQTLDKLIKQAGYKGNASK